MGVKFGRQFVQIKRDPVRLMNIGGGFDHPRILRDELDEADLAGIAQQAEIGVAERRGGKIEARKRRLPLP